MSADLKAQANCRGHIGLLKPSNAGINGHPEGSTPGQPKGNPRA